MFLLFLDLISTLILICLYLFSHSCSCLISYSRPSHVCCALSRAFSFARIDFRVLSRVRTVCHTLTRVLSRTRSDFHTLYRVFLISRGLSRTVCRTRSRVFSRARTNSVFLLVFAFISVLILMCSCSQEFSELKYIFNSCFLFLKIRKV